MQAPLGSASASCPFFIVYADDEASLVSAFANATDWRGLLKKRDAFYAFVLRRRRKGSEVAEEGSFVSKTLNAAFFTQDDVAGRQV